MNDKIDLDAIETRALGSAPWFHATSMAGIIIGQDLPELIAELREARAALDKLESDGILPGAPGDHPHTAWQYGYNAGYRDRETIQAHGHYWEVHTPNPYGIPPEATSGGGSDV